MSGRFDEVSKTVETVGDAFDRTRVTTEEVVSIGRETNDQREQREQGRTREIIAVWLLGLLCVVVALVFTAYFLDLDDTEPKQRFVNLKALLDVLFGPIVTLLSSAVGFYFGSRAAQAQAEARKDDKASPAKPSEGS